MLSIAGSQNQGQGGENRPNHTQRALNNGVTNVILSVPWVIAYFVVFAKIPDDGTCTGIPYNFGQFARWAYLAATISEIILFPMRLVVAKKKDKNEESDIATLTQILGSTLSCFLVAVWIYACIALSRRESCANDSLVSLLWATVLIPGILMGFCCCCCCCLLVTAGAAVGIARNIENNQQIHTQEANPANQLRQNLEEERKKLEMQMAEVQNTHKIEMA